ncbi:uncharacterized protein LOC109820461 [Asparagus officinalis]|uniref:uncharacterized protein LOC109820461 n=1 Tax=Asparagus officinalis TaxID=4686 RepID=UPI00098DF29D|nr:uncharacterized protein LOC109820461 [Asparagus officinalis]
METMEQRIKALNPIHSQVRRIKLEDEKIIEEKFKIHRARFSDGRARLQRSRSPLGLGGRAISIPVGN